MVVGVLYRDGVSGSKTAKYYFRFYEDEFGILKDEVMRELEMVDNYEIEDERVLGEISKEVDDFNVARERRKESDLIRKIREMTK